MYVHKVTTQNRFPSSSAGRSGDRKRSALVTPLFTTVLLVKKKKYDCIFTSRHRPFNYTLANKRLTDAAFSQTWEPRVLIHVKYTQKKKNWYSDSERRNVKLFRKRNPLLLPASATYASIISRHEKSARFLPSCARRITFLFHLIKRDNCLFAPTTFYSPIEIIFLSYAQSHTYTVDIFSSLLSSIYIVDDDVSARTLIRSHAVRMP